MTATAHTETRTARGGGLLSILGVAFGIAVIVGNTIGAGILRAPGDVATQLPAPGWFLAAWLAGGLYALLGVASLAELGVLIPRSGGQYVFARAAFGTYAGFVIGWTDWISSCAAAAAVTIVIGEYSASLVATTAWEVPIAVAVTLAFVVIQWRGIVWGDRAQQITSVAKGLVFALLIGAIFLAPPLPPAPAAASVAAAPTFVALVIALQGVIYTYDGWNGMLYFSGEVRDPGRQIPRAMFAGVVSVIAIYVLLNAGFVRLVGMSRLAGEPFVAAVAARAVFGAAGDLAIRLLLIVGLLSAANAIILMCSRVLHAMSTDGVFPRAASRVNTGGTPTVALGLSSAVIVLMLATGSFGTIIALAAFFYVLQYVTSFAAVFALRRKLPDAPRPYRAIGFPVTTAISLAGGVAFLVAAVVGDPRTSLVAFAILAVSYPVYRATVSRTAAGGA
jgi:APA family basic amino acid/polyamine antiporter